VRLGHCRSFPHIIARSSRLKRKRAELLMGLYLSETILDLFLRTTG